MSSVHGPRKWIFPAPTADGATVGGRLGALPAGVAAGQPPSRSPGATRVAPRRGDRAGAPRTSKARRCRLPRLRARIVRSKGAAPGARLPRQLMRAPPAGRREPETQRPRDPSRPAPRAGALRRPQERHLPGGSRRRGGGRGRTVRKGGRGGSGAACRPRGSAPPGPPTALV